MTEIPREIITQTLRTLNDLEGMKVSELVRIVDENENYFNVRFQGDYYGHDGACDWSIVGDRYEDDREYENRLEIIAQLAADKKKAKKTRLERERAEYERLKKKFEKA